MITRNGQSYGNGDVLIAMLGSIDYEVTKLSYSKKQAHTANYSLGSNDPTSYGVGKNEYSCTLGLRLKSIAVLERAAGGDLTKIKPFTIVCTVLNDENELITDKIRVKFKEQLREFADDDDIKAEFEMFCLGIKFNV